MSPAARQIVREALREDVSVLELSNLASADPAFAVRVLALANSAAYSSARQVGSVQVAASMLGVRGLRNAALGMLVAEMVPAAEGANDLLEICLRRALVAKRLAELGGVITKEEAFLAGLLLEIGLLQQACDEFDRAIVAARSPGRTRMLREISLGLVSHPLAGASIASDLQLPEALATAILSHHDPSPPDSPLGRICWAAEYAASVLELGDGARSLRLAQAACAQVGIKVNDLGAELERIDGETRELAHAIGDHGAPPEVKTPRNAESDLAELMLQYEDALRYIHKRSH